MQSCYNFAQEYSDFQERKQGNVSDSIDLTRNQQLQYLGRFLKSSLLEKLFQQSRAIQVLKILFVILYCVVRKVNSKRGDFILQTLNFSRSEWKLLYFIRSQDIRLLTYIIVNYQFLTNKFCVFRLAQLILCCTKEKITRLFICPWHFPKRCFELSIVTLRILQMAKRQQVL